MAVGKCCDTLGYSVNCSSGRRSSGGVKPELSNPMTTANCPGNEELDFRLIFGEEGQQQPLGPAGQWVSTVPSGMFYTSSKLKALVV